MENNSVYKVRINKKMDKQINKGIEKYGVTLEGNPIWTHPQKLDHLAEELIDGLFYIEHLRSAHATNEIHKEIIIDAVGSLIYLITKIGDQELKSEMVDNIKAINNAVKDMI